MKIPVVYEVNGRRRCLLVQDGETISVGSGEACSLRLEGAAVQEVELTAQFVNGCQFVVVHPAHGGVPYAQALPWKLPVGGAELLRPFRPEKGAAGAAEREIVLQGLGAGETRLLLKAEQPLLLGSGAECEVRLAEAGCPEALLALWAAGGKIWVQVLDNSAVVGWLGREGEGDAELQPPFSLSIGGRVILISMPEGGAAPSAQVAKPVVAAVATAATAAAVTVPKSTAILAKSPDAVPKIVSRQAKAGERPAEPVPAPVQREGGKPAVLPRSTVLASGDDFPLLTAEAKNAPKPYSPTLFILASWLLVGLMFAVAALPQQGVLLAEQMLLLWKVTGGLLILTLLLGLGVLLK